MQMASLQPHHHTTRQFCHRFAPPLQRNHGYISHRCGLPASFRGNTRKLKLRRSGCVCEAKNDAEVAKLAEGVKEEDHERPPFDINLAVVLAGFAFEAYRTPPENVGRCEIDAAGCKTVYLSESFVREIYDGQLFIKLKKGFEFPAMDPWGTSDPYVVMQLDGQVVKSKTKWGTKEPSWNEEFTFHIKLPPTKNLQVAAWDANLVTPHKRMGNAGINLDCLCDGNMHEVLVKLEGMGGGGQLQLEVEYKSFEEIEEENKRWRLPIIAELLQKSGVESALKMAVGSESVPARQFVEYAFGQLKLFNGAYPWHNSSSLEGDLKNSADSGMPETGSRLEATWDDSNIDPESQSKLPLSDNGGLRNGHAAETAPQASEIVQSDKHYWRDFADGINQMTVQKLGLPVSLELKWEGFDLLKRLGVQSQKIAEAGYIESGLATPKDEDASSCDKGGSTLTSSTIQSSLPDIMRATQDLLRQTDSVFGALMVLTSAIAKLNKESPLQEEGSESENLICSLNGSALDEKKAEEMRALFSTAESAMEAWAMLATSLGHPSFIKSEFEKICFLDNESTDTQVAIWRDSSRRRLVVAFRGTEQSKWKDLRTDLMLVPAGLNPERIGGDFKQEVQVHSGFLGAYDSVRIRIISIVKWSIGYRDDVAEPRFSWHIYVTGHSLGGALATLLALELSSSQLAKHGVISVTMYNFGSPRVGNKKFAEVYNQKVKDSWRVVNHRDIIPTVPRLMGYSHVAQPVYLAPGELKDTLENLELLKDGYQGDVIGEYTPDVLVNEFLKGEKELIEKILHTEINIFRAIRDGSALMQHMEDFYYITLLENLRSNYQTSEREEIKTQDTKLFG